jgi:DnaJ homolog subfamily C member 7
MLLLLTGPRTDLVSTEPAYFTNRAAAYIAIKRFRPALADCQHATSLQTTSTGVPAPPKTLLRLARCQLALAQTTAALSTLRGVLAAEPGSAPAVQMQTKALELEAHVRNLEASRRRGEWAMARVALDRCLLAIEAEGSELPTEWRLWQVEIELARGNWDGANSAAKCVSPLLFHFPPPLFFSFCSSTLFCAIVCRQSLLSDALRLQSSSPDVLALRGLVLFLCGRLPQALQHAQSALRFDPGHEPAQRLRKRVKEVERLKEEGNQAFKLGKLQEALSLYTNALEVRSRPPSRSSSLTKLVLSWLENARMKGRAVICVHCYCPTAPPPSSRYYLSLLITLLSRSYSSDPASTAFSPRRRPRRYRGLPASPTRLVQSVTHARTHPAS